jgi:lactoylglutathione lyase
MAFVHISIRTSDMDRTIGFYGKYFGMKLANRREIVSTDSEIAFLEDTEGGFRLELTHFRKQKKFVQAEYEERVFDHLAFLVDDMGSLLKRMKKDGVIVTDEPFTLGPGGSTLAFIEDPDGTLIELIQKR